MAKTYSNLPGVTAGSAPKYISTGNPTQDYTDMMNQANAANQLRYEQGLGLWDKIAGTYAPGGSYGQGALASYQRGMNQALSQAGQQMISSGMYGGSASAMLAPSYEQSVGNEFRLNLQDAQTRGYTGALQGAAGWIQGRNDIAPKVPDKIAQPSLGNPSAPKGGGTPGRYANNAQFQPATSSGNATPFVSEYEDPMVPQTSVPSYQQTDFWSPSVSSSQESTGYLSPSNYIYGNKGSSYNQYTGNDNAGNWQSAPSMQTGSYSGFTPSPYFSAPSSSSGSSGGGGSSEPTIVYDADTDEFYFSDDPDTRY